MRFAAPHKETFGQREDVGVDVVLGPAGGLSQNLLQAAIGRLESESRVAGKNQVLAQSVIGCIFTREANEIASEPKPL